MAKKRGLGRSLDALLIGSLSPEELSPASDKQQLSQLSVDLIQRGKYQPRREIDPDALQELADSIRAQGIIQPIVVRQVLGGRYEIIAGERRWRAAQLAGLTEVPALVRDIPDEAAIAIALIENIQRENLNPIEEALALQRLLEEFDMTHQQVAEAVSKSRVTVTNLLRLLGLPDEVKKLLEQRQIEMGHARALLTLSLDDQCRVANLIVTHGLSVRDTEERVRNMQNPKLPELPKAIDPDVKRLQQDLSARLKLPVALLCNAKGKGKLVISYKNLTELDALLEYFECS